MAVNKTTIVALAGTGLLAGGILWYLGDNNYLPIIPINTTCRGLDQTTCGTTGGCNWYAKYFIGPACYDVAETDYMRYLPLGLMGVGAVMLAFGILGRSYS